MRNKPTLTPQALFDWARAHCLSEEALGHGSQYPSFSSAARHFGTTLDEVESACGDWGGPGYMGAGVASGTASGHSRRAPRGQWLVEAYL